MDASSIILVVIAIIVVWLIVATLIAVVLGRTAAAGQHEHDIGAMAREMRGRQPVPSAPAQKSDARGL